MLLQNELKKNSIDKKIEDLAPSAFEFKDEHFNIVKNRFFNSKIGPKECKDITKLELKILFDDVEKYVKEIEIQNFNRAQAEKVVSMINDFVNSRSEKIKSSKFEYTQNFRAAIMVYIFRYANAKFKKMHYNYMEKVDPRGRRKFFKDQLFTKFKHVYNRSATEKIAADLVSKYLEKLIKDIITRDLRRELAKATRANNTFMHAKRDLQRKVLTDLLEESSFEKYKLFISNASTSIRKWLKKYVSEYLFNAKRKNYEITANIKLDKLVSNVITHLSDIPVPANSDKILENWIKSFVKEFCVLLGATDEGLNEVKNIQVEGQFDFENFNSILTDNLRIVQTAMRNEYKSATVVQWLQSFI